MDILQTITELSHEFGTIDFVRGGGGNTSCKDEKTLWVKPSGTTLAGLQPESFVALDRNNLSKLYQVQTPSEPSKREKLVKEIMSEAVLQTSQGRASVEAPLHDSLNARYVVHTHPYIVNGLTCAKNGRAVCNELFPSALWLDYIDPGYTLCMQVRTEIQQYEQVNSKQPDMIFLKNHGVFVSADDPDQLRQIYNNIIQTLKNQYEAKNISLELEIGPVPSAETAEKVQKLLAEALSSETICIAASGMFTYPKGPISPDHIVYAKSYPYIGLPASEEIDQFNAKHGYNPKIVVCENAVFGIGYSDKKAALALELAQDGTLVQQLANAFGGIEYMTDQAREFIENWEVESYRSKQL